MSGSPRRTRKSASAVGAGKESKGVDAPLLEPNRTRIAIIEPSRVIKPIDIAEHCVLCFFNEVIAQLVREGAEARVIHNAESEAGDYPVYEIDYGHRRLAVVHPGVGAPNAAVTTGAHDRAWMPQVHRLRRRRRAGRLHWSRTNRGADRGDS